MPETPKSPRRIADDHVVRVAALDPATSTRLGLHPEDDRQPDLSPDGFEALAEVARQTLTALDTTALVDDPAELDCARLLRERLTAELAVHEAGDHYRQLRNVNSPLHKVRGVFTMMPTDTAEQWAAVAGRLRNVPGALHGYRATLAEGIGRGLLSAPRQARAAIAQLDAWTGRAGGGTSWFTGFVADGPAALRPELDAAAERATAATAAFRDWLADTYLPAADGTPDAVGREHYLRCARSPRKQVRATWPLLKEAMPSRPRRPRWCAAGVSDEVRSCSRSPSPASTCPAPRPTAGAGCSGGRAARLRRGSGWRPRPPCRGSAG
ncbi:DUF885 domain-containing protein [Streptomyces viridifaciens]|nr:DUF885 domain-containing protein [Streptomyces viridifaciens]